MGCTGDKTYEEAVKEELRRYLHNFKLSNIQEKEIKNYISQDLTKKAIALNNYQYIYRDEDAKETAEEYKKLIMEKFHIGFSMYEQKPKTEEEKNNNQNNTKTNNINNINNINNSINNTNKDINNINNNLNRENGNNIQNSVVIKDNNINMNNINNNINGNGLNNSTNENKNIAKPNEI